MPCSTAGTAGVAARRVSGVALQTQSGKFGKDYYMSSKVPVK